MSGFLLDTHVALWLLDDNPRLGSATRRRLADGAWFSAASAWELAIKASLGKVAIPGEFAEAISASGMQELPVTSAHVPAVGDVSLPHRDPFDSLLVAQSRIEGLKLVTADEKILAACPDAVDARS